MSNGGWIQGEYDLREDQLSRIFGLIFERSSDTVNEDRCIYSIPGIYGIIEGSTLAMANKYIQDEFSRFEVPVNIAQTFLAWRVKRTKLNSYSNARVSEWYFSHTKYQADLLDCIDREIDCRKEYNQFSFEILKEIYIGLGWDYTFFESKRSDFAQLLNNRNAIAHGDLGEFPYGSKLLQRIQNYKSLAEDVVLQNSINASVPGRIVHSGRRKI